MGVEPRFRGLMARTVLLVYTLFELLGSEVPIVSASAAPCAAFATVVVDDELDEERVDGVFGLAVEADEVGAGAVLCEFVEELVDVVFVHWQSGQGVLYQRLLSSWWLV